MVKIQQHGCWFSVTKDVLAPYNRRRAGLFWLGCALAAMGIGPAQAQTVTETVLLNFGSPPNGANPYASVTRDSAGNLYGTTVNGGASNAGVVFKLDTTGHQTVLHNFTGGADGGYPYAGVFRDSAGNLYGTTYSGGAGGRGVVFQLDTAGHETVLHSFTGGADGGYPYAGVIADAAGNLYGTASAGGAPDWGVVYQLEPTGHLTVLYTFTGGTDGGYPYAGVILDPAGNLYGTAAYGGSASGFAGAGVVFKLNAAGDLNVVYSFGGGADGTNPEVGVIRDSAGNLYGTTQRGGAADAGIVYKLDTTDHLTVLYSFTDGADGGYPAAGVVRDSAGNLYGTTVGGGTAYAGVVYKLNAAGGESALFSFTGGADGDFPYASVILDPAGSLYGTTAYSGATQDFAGAGVVFKVDPTGHETVLYGFPGVADGYQPYAGVIRDPAGNLYGTTQRGGAADSGVVYELDMAGHEAVLYSFTGLADGGYLNGVIRDASGNLYGTAQIGGTAGAGVVYKLDPTGHETVLYSFTGGAEGAYPQARVIRDVAGTLYGTTSQGGTAYAGVVYKLDMLGHETVLYTFTGGADGGFPYAGVIHDSAGNIYGTTTSGGTRGFGVVYKLDTAGHETVLYSFTGGADGGRPYAGVIRDAAGNLYGTTVTGGAGFGVVYKLDAAGHETTLYTFTGGADGNSPNAGVIHDAAGNLYGTTTLGGAGFGVVYKLDTAGHETVLYSFTGGADGGKPYAGVIGDGAGNLYGTTDAGGQEANGVVFELKAQ